jgi:hypothetical protein
VSCVDDPPDAVNDSASVGEDAGATAVTVLSNDTDIDGGPKTITAAGPASHGSVAITGGGTGLTYQPAGNYCGPDSFTYTLNGGDSATVSMSVTCLDDPPNAVNDSATVAEDAAATPVSVLANDTDIDGGTKSINSVTQAAHGTVAITGGGTGLTYKPDANYCGADSFTYTLNGGDTATVSVTVTCVDDPPAAVADSATVSGDAGATAVDVLGNDTDIDGGPMTIASVTQPSHGTVVITGGGAGLTYQPSTGYCGADSFTYKLNGGSTATVSVTVDCTNPPVAVGDAVAVAQDSGPNLLDVLANDTDSDGGPMTIASVTQPSGGTVAITGGGAAVTYQPLVGYCNSQPGAPLDNFIYTLNGNSSATVAVSVVCQSSGATAGVVAKPKLRVKKCKKKFKKVKGKCKKKKRRKR